MCGKTDGVKAAEGGEVIAGIPVEPTFCENCDQDDEVIFEFDCGHWLCDFCVKDGCPLCAESRERRDEIDAS